MFVTHEQEEAFDLGDRVAVLHRGRLEQVGTADQLYEEPASAFVAGFVGRTAALPGQRVGGRAGTTALVRPEALRFVTGGAAPLEGVVTERRFVGAQAYFTVDAGAGVVFDVQAPLKAVRVGEHVKVEVDRVLYWAEAGAPVPGGVE